MKTNKKFGRKKCDPRDLLQEILNKSRSLIQEMLDKAAKKEISVENMAESLIYAGVDMIYAFGVPCVSGIPNITPPIRLQEILEDLISHHEEEMKKKKFKEMFSLDRFC